jgi:glycosyltransferase involved in cell wall biosynthesis
LKRTVAFDLSRMFIAAAAPTPRGIDRVDMGYASRFFADPEMLNVGLVPLLGNMGVLSGAEAWSLARVVGEHWRNGGTSHAGLHEKGVSADASAASSGAGERNRRSGRAAAIGRYIRMVGHARWAGFRRATRRVPEGSLYVNTGQILLGCPPFFSWFERRPDVRPVFMLHDLIPMRHPEYSGPFLCKHHSRAVRTAARCAAALIATSHAAADELRQALREEGRSDLPIHVAPLPVDDDILETPTTGQLPREPYFVMVGSIDQRKNHRLILHVWRDMIRRDAAAVPKLVIVGPRGLRAADILDFIERSPGLAERVIVRNGLSTPAMREVVRGARALLMPSFTEGFGLPIIEALTLGVPVIASDIPAHREAGGAHAIYIDPLDGFAWRDAILAGAEAGLDVSVNRRIDLLPYRPRTWSSYFDDVVPFLESL